MRRVRMLGVLVALVVVLAVALPALAVGFDFEVEVPDGFQPGPDDLTLDSRPVPAELVGLECQVTATVTNNKSEWPNNAVHVKTGNQVLVVPGVEDVADVPTSRTAPMTLGADVIVVLIFGQQPDGSSGTSLGMRVTVECPEGTTTIAETTTTTIGETTTTVADETTTTTSEPTTTRGVTSTPTLVPAPTTAETLPFTGPEDIAPWAIAGSAALLLGLILVLTARRDETE